MKKLSQTLMEKLAPKEVDPKKFPDAPGKADPAFFKKGTKDGEKKDDIVKTKKATFSAQKLKASQDAVYLGKSLGMAIGGVEGGDLGGVASKDNHILDGHHRWAATIFNNPNAKITAAQSDLNIGDLIPVLKGAGDALGNQRGTEPKGGDVNIFKATMKDIKACIYDGKNMHPDFYDKEKSITWFEKIGEKEVEKRLKLLQSLTPPKGAPARKDMPKIEPDQVDKVSKDLEKGNIDVRAPYADDTKKKKKTNEGLSEFLTESIKSVDSKVLNKRAIKKFADKQAPLLPGTEFIGFGTIQTITALNEEATMVEVSVFGQKNKIKLEWNDGHQTWNEI
jgi:hypothetical protein